jgi:hypothetical protein
LVKGETTVVLIYDPRDCFSCYGALWEWIQWGRSHPDDFTLIFTRDPTTAEQKRLTAYRVRPDAILGAKVSQQYPSPSELLFINGHLHYKQLGSFGQLTAALLRIGPETSVKHLASMPPAVSSGL